MSHAHTDTQTHNLISAHEGLTKMDSEVIPEQIPSDVCITNDDFKVYATISSWTFQPCSCYY